MSKARRAVKLLRRTTKKLRRSASTVRLRRKLRSSATFRPDTPPQIDVLLNYPDGLRNLYQVRQWYGPLEYLADSHKVAILCYRPESAQQIADETDLKVVLTPSLTDLSEVRDSLSPKVVLYPNQNYTNYRILGLDRAQHVFICHGESDKIYMASNWIKIFNYFFIAGEASRDRLKKYVRNYDADGRTIKISRPQVDIKEPPIIEKSNDRITVLYAPTWEGGRTTMRYGSVESHGRQIIESLIADGGFQIIYRPHPRTGIHLREVKAADREIREQIEIAQENDPSAGHLVDDSPFGWQLEFADFMITDTSAVAYDWLTTAKPLLITQPVEPSTIMPDSGYLAATHLLHADQAGESATIIKQMLKDPEILKEQHKWSTYYYGERTPGSSLAKFEQAIDQTIREIDSFNSRSQPPRTDQDARLNFAEDSDEEHPEAAASLERYGRSVNTQIANQFARFRHEAALDQSLVSASTGRKAAIVVTCMALPRNTGNLVDWFRALEAINRTHPVVILTGNLRTHRLLKSLTGLRLLVAFSAVRTEWIVQELSPQLILHFEQSKLNLREATYRTASHIYIGEEGNNDWINNRLRLFDEIIATSHEQIETIQQSIFNLPSTTKLTACSRANRVEVLRQAVEEQTEYAQKQNTEEPPAPVPEE